MKIYILLLLLSFSLTLTSQNFNKEWNTVIELEKEDRIKQALTEVEKIEERARKKNSEPELIRVFFYKSKYLQRIDEESQSRIINNLILEIENASPPTKALYNFIYAQSLKEYLIGNRYTIRNRTATEGEEDQNFLNWSADQLEKQIELAVNNSLNEVNKLKNTPISKYKDLLNYSRTEFILNQTLFDFLIDNYIDFYSKDLNLFLSYENDFLKEKKELLFSNPEAFTNINFEGISNTSVKRVLELYQKKEANQGDKEIRFERMQFIHNYIFKDALYYIKILNQFQNDVEDNILIQNIQLQKAKLFESLANKNTFPEGLKKAVSILDSIIDYSDHHFNIQQASYQKQQILNKSVSIKMNQFVYENQNTRAHITYKNIDTIFISYYKLPATFMLDDINRRNDSLVSSISKTQRPAYTNHINLPPPAHDYFETSTEFLLPKLSLGKYLVIFEDEQNSIQTNKAFAYSLITVSNLAILHHQIGDRDDSDKIFQVLNRQNGKPIEDVQLNYNNQTQSTDNTGIASFKVTGRDYTQRHLLAHKGNDSLYIQVNHWALNLVNPDSKEEEENEEIQAQVNFYSDRGIYRPGQTVFIKGIAIQTQNGKTSVVPGVTFFIEILDPDYNTVKEFDIQTNEYGSFTFEFTAPKNGLTGTYSIEAEEGDTIKNDKMYDKKKGEHLFWDKVNFRYPYFHISVEEYKRPTFNVKIDPIKEAYSVNDTVIFTGEAKAFSGAKISNAKVVYRVERKSNVRFGFGYSNNTETIAEGETITDGEGKLSIPFKAIPDEFFEMKDQPVFHYTVYVDVTDINGETHSTQQHVKIGYHSILLKAEVNKDLYLQESNKITLASTNLNDQFVPVTGKIEMYYIKPLQHKFITPQFPEAENTMISSEEFEHLFPFEKNSENNHLNNNGKLIFSKEINTAIDTKIDLQFLEKQPFGHYKVIFAASQGEEQIETSSYFRFINKEQVNPDELFTVIQKNKDPFKDAFLTVDINSQVTDLFVNIQGVDTKDSSIFYEGFQYLKTGKITLNIPIRNTSSTDLAFHIEAFYENHFFEKEIRIKKEENLPLDVEVVSMRSTLEPGSQETWSFIIKEENKAAKAEVLTSMYDQSLDEFKVSHWNVLSQNNYSYYYSNRNQKSISTQVHNFNLKNLNPSITKPHITISKTSLQWFGFSFGNTNNYTKSYSYQNWLKRNETKPANAVLIYGVVKDDTGLPLPGVNILVKGTNRGTQTDFDGYYEIEIAPEEELIFTYVGFSATSLLPVQAKNNITMVINENELSQVVVTGFALKREKKALGYAVSQIINEEYDEDAIARTLSGKTSGVVINNAAGESGTATNINIRGYLSVSGENKPLIIIDGVILEDYDPNSISLAGILPSDIEEISVLKGFKATEIYGSRAKNGVIIITTKKALQELTQIETRKNFQETAFFYPQLRTNRKGEIQFEFTTPEALTKWKFRLFAHNKEGNSGYIEKVAVTQKELMITPNMPRFFREKDTITLTARIANMTPVPKTGTALLQLFDAVTMNPLKTGVIITESTQSFHTDAQANTVVSWQITIPEGIQGIQYKVVAKSGNYSDGEENLLPVLKNSMLVTESIPIWVTAHTKKDFTLENLKNNVSTTLKNHKLTLEYTSNPTWLAIEALPYLMEFEHECSEQTFARYYANMIALKILNENPKIAEVFQNWKEGGKSLSKLAQNEDLKNILLAETPWLLDSESEEERNNRMALLFDLNKMSQNTEVLIEKLAQMQSSSGGFPWFQGGFENRNITEHILIGLAKLENYKLNVSSFANQISKKGIEYADSKFLERHSYRKDLDPILISAKPEMEIDYLYLRSFYINKYPLDKNMHEKLAVYLDPIVEKWVTLDLHHKAKAALILNRFDQTAVAKKIIVALKETSALNTESGMFWISNKPGWRWKDSPIENQALIMEAFNEVDRDTASIEKMKIWLLKNKQTKNWPTTKATTEAVHALLSYGGDALNVEPSFTFQLGDNKIDSKDLINESTTAGSGYIRLNYFEDEITKDKASLTVENKSKLPSYGGLYWQYFEELDKIPAAPESLFQVSKEFYLKKNTPSGQVLQKIEDKTPIKTGDIVTVKMIISSKEDVEFVHLKDMRASGLEPIEVLSQYKRKDGVSFYQSTRDAATHFFFDIINKGTYVLEYDLRANNEGSFSNGITTIQSMYSPEFSNHTKGIRINVEE